MTNEPASLDAYWKEPCPCGQGVHSRREHRPYLTRKPKKRYYYVEFD